LVTFLAYIAAGAYICDTMNEKEKKMMNKIENLTEKVFGI